MNLPKEGARVTSVDSGEWGISDKRRHALAPRLQARDVHLRELTVNDAPGVFRWAESEQIAKTTMWEAHKDLVESTQYLQDVHSRISVEPGITFFAWAVCEGPGDGVPIGMVTLTELGNVRAQIGFVFHYDHWRSRLPAEALQLALSFSFLRFKQFERIQARCSPVNTVSTELLKRVGMTFEGINRSMARVRGEVVDLTCYAMTRPQWGVLSAPEGGWTLPNYDGAGFI